MLYVNDLPQVSEFSTTLFADDTYLALSDKSLVSLETKVNTQLQNIDIWLRRNKLSLNYSKTTYLLCNKHPYQSIKTKFTVVMNEKVLRRSDFVKYLGVYIDEKLTWSVHVDKLSLPEVESSRTSLASRTSSRTHFEVLGLGLGLEGQVLGLGLGLEASSPRKLACPRLEDSTIF